MLRNCEWDTAEPKDDDEPAIFCYAIGTAEECPDCMNKSCYEPCKINKPIRFRYLLDSIR